MTDTDDYFNMFYGEIRLMILGLTGSIASGKSFVADTFVACGAKLVSADLLAREVVNPGSPTLAKLVDAFGLDILTPAGSLNREVMAQKVFADPSARRRLEVNHSSRDCPSCRMPLDGVAQFTT